MSRMSDWSVVFVFALVALTLNTLATAFFVVTAIAAKRYRTVTHRLMLSLVAAELGSCFGGALPFVPSVPCYLYFSSANFFPSLVIWYSVANVINVYNLVTRLREAPRSLEIKLHALAWLFGVITLVAYRLGAVQDPTRRE